MINWNNVAEHPSFNTPSEPPLTEAWFEKIGERLQNDEEFKDIAPILYAISKEIDAIKRINQTEELLNVPDR